MDYVDKIFNHIYFMHDAQGHIVTYLISELLFITFINIAGIFQEKHSMYQKPHLFISKRAFFCQSMGPVPSCHGIHKGGGGDACFLLN